jgi:hypothetical protein
MLFILVNLGETLHSVAQQAFSCPFLCCLSADLLCLICLHSSGGRSFLSEVVPSAAFLASVVIYRPGSEAKSWLKPDVRSWARTGPNGRPNRAHSPGSGFHCRLPQAQA